MKANKTFTKIHSSGLTGWLLWMNACLFVGVKADNYAVLYLLWLITIITFIYAESLAEIKISFYGFLMVAMRGERFSVYDYRWWGEYCNEIRKNMKYKVKNYGNTERQRHKKAGEEVRKAAKSFHYLQAAMWGRTEWLRWLKDASVFASTNKESEVIRELDLIMWLRVCTKKDKKEGHAICRFSFHVLVLQADVFIFI